MNAHALELAGLGYDVIPIAPGSKLAMCADWQRLPPAEQWRNAPNCANIGIRGGGDVRALVLDCDDMPTFERASRFLAGLGYMPDGDYPQVRTAHDRRHVYASLADVLPGDWRKLRRDFGKGELRYGPGSYVIGVGSVVDGRSYELLQGDFRQLPRLERVDLRPLIDADVLPVLRTTPDTTNLPRAAAALLAGKEIERYGSRSEAEYALLVALVNAGYAWGGILELLLLHPGPGKFAELRKERGDREAVRYLRHSYDSAATWARAHESAGRQAARAAHEWALQRPWPGRTGNSDRAIFLAHTVLAYQAGRGGYAASVRDLAEVAGVATKTAYKANRRLVTAGLLGIKKGHREALATRYNIAEETREVTTLPHGCNTWGSVVTSRVSHDAFRFRGLGKVAAQILDALEASPGMTATELAEATGRHVWTIRRRLKYLAGAEVTVKHRRGKETWETTQRLLDPATGEIVALVERAGDGWCVVRDVDLGNLARMLGTDGAGARQAQQHADERAGFRRAIERAQAGDTPRRETPADVRAAMARADVLIGSSALRTPGDAGPLDVLDVLRAAAPAALTLDELAAALGMPAGALAVRLAALCATGRVDRLQDAETRYAGVRNVEGL